MNALRPSLRRLLFALLLPILPLPAQSATPTAAAGDIAVAVSTVRDHDGEIICALFDTADGFEKRIPLAKVLAHPQSPATTCLFRNVKAGIYAVIAFHDENGNGRLDKTFYGKPTEGYGVSNNHTYAMHGPRFGESTFTFSGRGHLAITIQLRYP
jgi:uncharacterized protein (DUF2141 family)